MTSKPKSVLITGCSAGGIGGALAEVFQEKGYHVFATARTPSKISPSLAKAPNVTVLRLDVISAESISAACESVRAKTGGRLDVLVNNSGGGLAAPALDIPLDRGRKLFDLNFWAPLAMIQVFAPLLIEAKGCIVNISSANAYLPLGFMSTYNASKGALTIASETWRRELQPFGVRVITLMACATKSQFQTNNPAVELPPSSRYYGLRDFVRNLTDGRLQKKAMTAREFATGVVHHVDKGSAGFIWAGTDSFVARLILTLAPASVIDMVSESIVPVVARTTKMLQGL